MHLVAAILRPHFSTLPKKFTKFINKNNLHSNSDMDTFFSDNVIEEKIADASRYIVVTLYEAKLNKSLSNSRYQLFFKPSKSAKFLFTQLPSKMELQRQGISTAACISKYNMSLSYTVLWHRALVLVGKRKFWYLKTIWKRQLLQVLR